jgi:beta-lactamase class A
MKNIPFLLFLMLFWNCNHKTKEAGLEILVSDIHSLLDSASGDFAVAFKDLQDSSRFILINEKAVFHAASTMKTPVMIEIYKQAAEGKFKMDDSVLVVNEFKSIVDRSLYSMDLGVDSQESLYDLIGKKSTMYDLTYEMITKSSNLATNILIEIVGANNVMRTMQDLGAHDIRVLRGVEDLKAYEAGLNNTTTAFDLMRITEAIAKGETERSEEMFGILADQYFNDQIPAFLPEEVVVAHKTGSITGVQHDSGIILLPDGRQYVLVTLSKDLSSPEEGKQVNASVSKLIYDFVQQD